MSEKKILLIEDEGIISMNAAYALRESGYSVTGSPDTGEDAIEMLKLERPDLAIIDITLDGMLDGIHVAEHINENYQIPIIYLTAHKDRDIIDRAKETNPFGILYKPCENKNLLRMVADALE